MNFSGIALTTHPDNLPALTAKINALEWAEVHGADKMGRMIVIVEGETTGEEVERLQELKRMPQVIFAEMVVHYFEEESQDIEQGMDQELICQYLESDDEQAPMKSYYQSLKQLGNH